MAKILIVENSKAIAQLVSSKIKTELDDIELTIANSLAQARFAMLESSDWLVAIVSLNLRDAPNGEIVDFVQSEQIPVIVLTGMVSSEVRETMLQKQVIDYVVKRNTCEIEHVAHTVGRIMKNKDRTILIADDSTAERKYIRQLLETHKFDVLEARNGEEALAILEHNQTVHLVIADYEMPLMNGIELVNQIRARWPREEMPIIGISATSEKNLSAALLKAGANDYIKKPFLVEEFYCRVIQNIEMLEQIQFIKDASNQDYLTKLYNRRYLFDKGGQLFERAKGGQLMLSAAMLDIDHFKSVNDNYGHKVGDAALCIIARTLQDNLPEDSLIARYGGEEFCVLLTGDDAANAEQIFEGIRASIENTPLPTDDEQIYITTSIGVSRQLGQSISELLNNADAQLYQAKNNGRNRVVLAA